MIRVSKRRLRLFISITLAVIIAGGIAGGLPARVTAAPVLTIQQITWSVIGLDSNNPVVGPQDFPVGVRVCNVGTTAANTISAAFNWTSSNAFIDLVPSQPNPITESYLGGGVAAGACRDIYFSVRVTQTAAAFDTTRSFTIDVTASDGITSANISTGQQLTIEHLISQNRNSTLSITGPTNVLVGSQYTWTVTAFTATNGYEELEHFLTFCPDVYRLDSVTTRYTAPKPATDTRFWMDGCSWDTSDNVGLPSREGCLADPGIKYGGEIVYNYNVTIVGAGACTLRDMVYDFSGSSYHYNADYPSVSLSVVATNPSCINGTVFKDETEDDTFNTGSAPPDIPLTNFSVTAYQDTNDDGIFTSGTDLVAATTTTDTSGFYNICVTGDTDSIYFVGVNASSPVVSGYSLETPVPNPGPAADSLPWTPTTGFTTTLNNFNFDFNPPGGITGFVYLDNGSGGTAGNLIKEGSEPGVSGQAITYWSAGGDLTCGTGDDGSTSTSAATSGAGAYTISNLAPGVYCLSAPTSIGTNALETSGSQPQTRTITVPAGAPVSTTTGQFTDFGYAPGGSITGFLYRDDGGTTGTAGNNLKDGDESGFGSQNVVAYRDDGDSLYEPGADDVQVSTVSTNSSTGQYVFPGLAAGNYWILGPASVGTYTLGTTNPVLVTATSGTTNSSASNDIGYDPPAPAAPGTITGAVYIDNSPQNNTYDTGTESGINAVTISIYLDDGDNIYEPGTGDTLVFSPVSSGSGVGQGTYSQSGLAAGTYWISAPATAGTNTLGTASFIGVTLTAGGGSSGNNFGYDPAATPGGISGQTYQDTDGDNVFDGGEPTINGQAITYYLDDGDGFFEPIVGQDGTGTSGGSTAGSGNYSISSLTPGNYWVLAPAAASGSRDIGTPNPLLVTVASGTTTTGQNFGYDLNNINILATAFRDNGLGGGTTADNTQNGTEPGVSTITINLIQDANSNGINDDAITATGTTDVNGDFIFPNLSSGTYFVQLVTGTIPAGLTLPGGEAVVTLSISGNSQFTATFALDASATVGTVSGVAFQDDGSGGVGFNDNTKQALEAGISSLTVTLFDSGNTVVATTTTASDGTYSFTNVTAGSGYYVVVSPSTVVATGYSLPTGEDTSGALTVTGGSTTVHNFPYDPPGRIGGFAFQDDTPMNGSRDSIEAGISGLTITLFDSGNNMVSSTTTGSDGSYLFSGVPVGSGYTVVISQTTSGSYTLSGSATSSSLTVLATSLTTWDFPFQPPRAISGVLFRDDGGTGSGTAGNGIQDGDEGGLSGVTVTLCDSLSNCVTTTTASDGSYIFSGLTAGVYTVSVPAMQSGYSLSGANPQSVDVSSSATGIANFPYVPLATIVGTVFQDDNIVDGTQDVLESGIPNITVTLLYAGPDNTFGNGDDTTTTAVTNGTGGYTFPNLVIGSYQVTVDDADPDLPANYVLGTPSPITLSPLPQGTSSVNFGFAPPGSVIGTVFIDNGAGGGTGGNGVQDGSEPGIPNITVTLTWFGPDGMPGGGDDVVYTTTTDSSGNYTFPVVPAGPIQIAVDTADPDLPPGVQIAPADATVTTTLTGGTSTQVDFPFTPPNGTINGVVFNDADFSTTYSGGEELVGVSVTLYSDTNSNGILDVGDTIAATTATNGSGAYSFGALGPGSYLVDVNELDPAAAGLTLTSTDPSAVTLPINGTATRDFVFVPGPAIQGTAFADLNSNGIQDPGEPGIPNITITLSGTTGGSAVTDANGDYVFTNLTAGGSYTVDIDEADPDLPAGYTIATTDPVNIASLPAGTSVVNFGFDVPPPASISGMVWIDTNGDGLYTVGEAFGPGMTVTLINATTSAVITTILTDGVGGYSFTGLNAGDYLVQATETDPPIPAGSILTTGANPRAVSGVTSGAAVTGVDFGYQPPAPASISGVAFNDNGGTTGTASNGLQDGDEAGLGGVTITLYRDNGDGVLTASDTLVATTTTSASGSYSFSNLAPGTYFAVETDPAGFVSTTSNSVTVPVSAGGSGTANFGDVTATNAISGVVYNDQNFSTSRDAGEPGLFGVTIELHNALGVTVATTTTDAGGNYAFTGLPDGSYTVVETDPAGYFSTTSNNVAVTLSGGIPASAEFGDMQSPGAISGVVFNDNGSGGGTASDGLRNGTEPGLASVTVQAYLDANSNGVLDPSDLLVRTTTTSVSGSYLMSNMSPGSYIVVETDLAGYVSVTSNEQPAVVTGGATTSNVNFADLFPPAAGTISGVVWEDADADGTLDSGEGGLAGASVALYQDLDGDGILDPGEPLAAQTITGAGGSYSFTNIGPGNYLVVETTPAGYSSTTPDTVALTMVSGGTGTASFGEQAASGTISGTVWEDANASTLQDGGEGGLSGVSVAIYRDVNGNGILDSGTDALSGTTTTGGTGDYSFSNVTPDTYIIVEIDPAGFISTTPNQVTRVVPPGGAATADFGDQLAGAGTITGTVWSDDDSSATLDAGELGIGGVTVSLYDSTGTTLIASASTNAGGGYTFTGLPDGNYLVIEIDPPGYLPPGSTPNSVPVTIAGNSQIVNFGDVPVPSALGGTVWLDSNSNGVINFAEPGIAGVTVTTYNDTNGNGLYDAGVDTPAVQYPYVYDVNDVGSCDVSAGPTPASASSGPLGTYSFPCLLPGAYVVVVTPPAGYTPTTPTVVSRVLPAGESRIVNFGFTDQPPDGTVFGTVWNDVNGNGIFDTGESGIPGVTVTLSDGTTTYVAITDASGGYIFTGIPQGNWTVTEFDLPGYSSTTPNIVNITLDTLNPSASVDFGDSNVLGTVTGVVWSDPTNPTVRDAGEPGIAGVTVTLTNGTVSFTTTTDASGTYTFANVPAGNWTVTETDPPGFASTTPNIVNITLVSGATATVDFGDVAQNGTIFGIVWDDANGSTTLDSGEGGMGGVTVTLFDSTGTTVIATTTTNASGGYSFTGLAAADYLVVETNPAGFSSTTPDTVASTVVAGTATAPVNFGDQAQPDTISGTVWVDVDGNGILDPGELGFTGGATITLFDSTGAVVIAATTTDASGNYIFTSVAAGDYLIVFDPVPTNFTNTTPTTIGPVTLAAGSSVAGQNFGIQANPGTITGRVWNDLNGNGIQDLGESGIQGVTIQLLDSLNNVVATATTDINGDYSFTNIPPGAYTIREVDPAGFTSTTPNSLSISLNAGGSASANFGDRQPVTGGTTGGSGGSGGGGGVADPDATIPTGDGGLLPPTGERPLWVRLAGPLTLLALAMALIGTAYALLRSRSAA